MGKKLNWGAALGSLAESLRTYAMMEAQKQQQTAEDKRRKDEIKQNQDFQTRLHSEDRAGRLQDRLAELEAQRGPQLGSVPMAGTDWESGGGEGVLRGLPKINVTQHPVYRQDVEGTGSLLGRQFAQMHGWGEKPQEQTYPFTTGGQTVQLPGDEFAAAALRRELDNGPGGSDSRVPSGSRVAMEVKRSLGGDWRNAELLGVNDDILMAAEDAINHGVPLQKALADAATQYLGVVDEQRMADLTPMLSNYLPHDVTNVEGRKKVTRKGVVKVGARPGEKKPGWGRLNDKSADPGIVVTFDEAQSLDEYREFQQAWSNIIRKGKVTRREIAEIRERFNLTDDQFYMLLARHNEAQGPQQPELDPFIKPDGE
jgi:hypothetical protein